jgi:hypothetical protein
LRSNFSLFPSVMEVSNAAPAIAPGVSVARVCEVLNEPEFKGKYVYLNILGQRLAAGVLRFFDNIMYIFLSW